MIKVLKALMFGLVAVFAFNSTTVAQPQLVHQGILPTDFVTFKLNVVKKFDYYLRALVVDDSVLYCMSGNRFTGWEPQFGIHWPETWRGAELVANQSGQLFIYDRWNDSLYFQWDVAIESRYCPGRPVIDAAGALHVIWAAPDSSAFYYGLSTDTLSSFDFLDTLSSSLQVARLLTSPNDSLVCATILYDSQDSLYKYLTTAGQPLDFESPAGILEEWWLVLSAYDLTINSQGDVYAVLLDVAGCPPGYYCHRAWIEDIGFRFIDIAVDDVMEGPAFQFSFGENGRILLIKDGTPPFGNIVKAFFVSLDYGNTWHESAFQFPHYYSFYGSLPRAFTDTVDFFYYSSYNGHDPYNVYYYPVPRDSIFLNILSTQEAEPLPVGISLSNYPNPFNNETVISFTAPIGSNATLQIFDIGGRWIKTLYDGHLNPGSNGVAWDATTFDGAPLPSGLYLARLKAGQMSVSHKMILLK